MNFKRSEKRIDWVDQSIGAWLNPESGVADISAVNVSSDGSRAAILAFVGDASGASWKVALVDTATGKLEIISSSSRSDGPPAFSPDGKTIAFRADRSVPGHFDLVLYDVSTQRERSLTIKDHWIDCFDWSPSGDRLLVVAAAFGANMGALSGAVDSPSSEEAVASWIPKVQSDADQPLGRSIWVCDASGQTSKRLTDDGLNPWQARWCGDESIVMIASDLPDENDWYNSTLRLIALSDGRIETIYRPDDQLVGLSASKDGQRIAVVDALCSDRGLGAGALIIAQPSGQIERIDHDNGDTGSTSWLDSRTLVYSAISHGRVALWEFNTETNYSRPLWSSLDRSIGERFTPTFFAEGGRIAIIEEGWATAPAIKVWQEKNWQQIYQCGSRQLDANLASKSTVLDLRWDGSDGLEVQGYFISPGGEGPFPLVTVIHGGPTMSVLPAHLARPDLGIALLLEAGYAVFRPNFRGSSGCGREFVAACYGDVGGRESEDVLRGIDKLVEQGLADPTRLGVTGVSYGGYLSAWLITQDDRFAAAVPVCPVTDWATQRLLSNIPAFCDMILEAGMEDLSGRFFTSSPVFFASRVKTPTLTIGGERDNCTPPSQAIEFYSALRLNGVRSELVMYPDEGHAIRGYPAKNDYYARLIEWFQTFMPSTFANSDKQI